MPDLSTVLDFSIELNFKDGKLYLTDTSAYPEGVASGITGIVKVTQPDSIVVEGQWGTPDVEYVGSALTRGEIELRTQSDGTPQEGAYAVEYTVDHASYSPTKKSKSFILAYTRPEVSISENFDVFAPTLSVEDDTAYAVGGFTTESVERLWSAQVGTVGTVAGTAETLDLAYEGVYYDAAYAITLHSTVTYAHTVYTYLTLVEELTGSLDTTANTPPNYTTLRGYLTAIKERFDALQSCAQTKDARADYEYAASLLSHIKQRLCAGETNNLYTQIQDFLNVYCGRTLAGYTNTDTAIPAYDYTDVDCGVGGTPLPAHIAAITSTDIAHWNEAYNSLPPAPMEFVVGVTAGAPVAGNNTFAHNSLVNRNITLHRSKIIQSTLSWNGDPYFSKPYASDTIQLYGDTWQAGELVQIHF